MDDDTKALPELQKWFSWQQKPARTQADNNFVIVLVIDSTSRPDYSHYFRKCFKAFACITNLLHPLHLFHIQRIFHASEQVSMDGL